MTVPSTLFLDLAPDDARALGAGPGRLAWLQAYDRVEGDYARVELWHAPAPPGPSEPLRPRLVREVEEGRVLAESDGHHYAFVSAEEGPRRIRIYDLRTGARRTLQTIPGLAVIRSLLAVGGGKLLLDAAIEPGRFTVVAIDIETIPLDP